jgi:hypothetical protein
VFRVLWSDVHCGVSGSGDLAWLAVEAAEGVVGERGVIVAEFFDVGCSRRVAWRDRPQTSALLAEVTSRDRRFDAVVVGEFEWAFAADQFEEPRATSPTFLSAFVVAAVGQRHCTQDAENPTVSSRRDRDLAVGQ